MAFGCDVKRGKLFGLIWTSIRCCYVICTSSFSRASSLVNYIRDENSSAIRAEMRTFCRCYVTSCWKVKSIWFLNLETLHQYDKKCSTYRYKNIYDIIKWNFFWQHVYLIHLPSVLLIMYNEFAYEILTSWTTHTSHIMHLAFLWALFN